MFKKTIAAIALSFAALTAFAADRAYTDNDGNTGVLHDTACKMEGGSDVPGAKAFSLTLNGEKLKGCYLEDGGIVTILLENGAMFQMPVELFQ